jgi:hypothetical protein
MSRIETAICLKTPLIIPTVIKNDYQLIKGYTFNLIQEPLFIDKHVTVKITFFQLVLCRW